MLTQVTTITIYFSMKKPIISDFTFTKMQFSAQKRFAINNLEYRKRSFEIILNMPLQLYEIHSNMNCKSIITFQTSSEYCEYSSEQ